MHDRSVFLFPGLGAYSTGVLRQARQNHPQVDETFDEIDTVAAGYGISPVSDVLFGRREASIKELLDERAELLQLAIFGTSVATYRILAAAGAEPYLLVGHSFGEMAALVCAEAFDLADGVRLVCARTEALRTWEGRGAMAAIGANETVVKHLIGLVEEHDLVIGCTNAPRQNVIAGPVESVARVGKAAEALGIFFARLNLPYASHHPSMHPAVPEFIELMGSVRQRPLRRPVLSPIHGRRYHDGDDLRRAIADCLILPVHFTEAVRTLHAQGCKNFVEVGALNALTRCVEATVPGVRTFAPLLKPEDETTNLRLAAEAVRGGSAPPPAVSGPAPIVTAPEAAAVVSFLAPATDSIPLARAENDAIRDPGQPDRNGSSRKEVFARLQRLYAEALEYPVELLTESAPLEAELGIDSLKQTSLLTKVVEEFGLADDPGELRVWEFATLGRITDHVVAAGQGALR